jgi:hypothetical protein
MTPLGKIKMEMAVHPEATLVFTDLVLAFMRATTDGGSLPLHIQDQIATGLIKLAVFNKDGYVPNVAVVAKFVCELEEAGR